ncbi:MAG: AAA family ATPase [Desulfobacteraceae bacterium]|nr:MAG: AAA family ATPase [Desulfobacteraceae bacterium]
MHLKRIRLFAEQYGTHGYYPFNLEIFQRTKTIDFVAPVTFFIGENGTGKSTLLEAIARTCGIHIWQNEEGSRFQVNPYEKDLYKFIAAEWTQSPIPGAFFSGELFRDFSQFLEEWAVQDPKMFDYFGCKSLLTRSHGQSLMSFFKARYKIRGLYLLDEPETALSARSQLELLKLLNEIGQEKHAQFIIATHSPILTACPHAKILSFNETFVKEIEYRASEHYKIYKNFMANPQKYLKKEKT